MKPANRVDERLKSDPRLDPPATVITARTRIVAARPTVSWAAALVAMGIFVGLVTAVVARGDADTLIDAAASFVDPSGGHAAAAGIEVSSVQTKAEERRTSFARDGRHAPSRSPPRTTRRVASADDRVGELRRSRRAPRPSRTRRRPFAHAAWHPAPRCRLARGPHEEGTSPSNAPRRRPPRAPKAAHRVATARRRARTTWRAPRPRTLSRRRTVLRGAALVGGLLSRASALRDGRL